MIDLKKNTCVGDDGLKHLAVFDLDGTCLDGSSTVRLVLDLVKRFKLGVPNGCLIGFWGIAYKMKLPTNEAWVRYKVWKAFVGKDKADADKFLHKYVDRVVEKIWRPKAQYEIDRQHAEGRDVIIVSASFEPIVERVCMLHNIDHQVSTVMKVDENGRYLRDVQGKPIEGAQKVLALKELADKTYGEGKWVCDYAFADHYSDIKLLETAERPCAVCPDKALEQHARTHGWTIFDWELHTEKQGEK